MIMLRVIPDIQSQIPGEFSASRISGSFKHREDNGVSARKPIGLPSLPTWLGTGHIPNLPRKQPAIPI